MTPTERLPAACRRVDPLLDPLLDGELDEHRARAVHAHLRTCEACARRLEANRQIVEAAGSLPPLDPPASLWESIDARLAEDSVVDAKRPGWWWWWQAWRRPVLTAGAALMATAVVLLVLWRGGGGPSTPLVATPAPADASGQAAALGSPPRPDLYAEAVREIEASDQRYRKAIDELRAIVGEERQRWRPEVARAFEENLATIDLAVERQREIARRTPADPVAQDALYAAYRREIDFLQEAVVRGEVQP